MKTIGVLGGMGPQATMEFERLVHRVSQRLIPPRAACGYPPMVVVYLRHPPFLAKEDLTPVLPMQPDPRLLEAAKKLGTMADFLVIASNSPHKFKDSIQAAAGREVLSIIDLTLAEIRRRGWKRVGVLGMGLPVVYTEPLGAMGIATETIEDKSREQLNGAILRVMEGRNDETTSAIARKAIASLRQSAVDGIILGCTEIPLLLQDAANESDLLNPLELLAEGAVRHAMG